MQREGLLAVSIAVMLVTNAGAQQADKVRDVQSKPAGGEKLAAERCGNIERLHALGGVFLASQPSKEDFKAASEKGIKSILNLREVKEQDFDEAKLVKELGMEYVNLPFGSAKNLSDEIFSESRKLLNDKKKQPMMMHCASANRVGAIWLAHRVLDGGLSYDAALAEAKQVGLRLPDLEAKAKDYIERTKAKSK